MNSKYIVLTFNKEGRKMNTEYFESKDKARYFAEKMYEFLPDCIFYLRSNPGVDEVSGDE